MYSLTCSIAALRMMVNPSTSATLAAMEKGAIHVILHRACAMGVGVSESVSGHGAVAAPIGVL